MKLSVNPADDFKAAPFSIKMIYILMWGMAISWAVSQILATVQGLSFLYLIGSLFLAYLVIDTGLVVLRGRAMAKGLTTFLSMMAIAAAVLTYLHIMAGDELVFLFTAVSAVIGLLLVILVNGKAMNKYLDEKGRGKVLMSKKERSQAKKGDVKPGSWDDIMRKQKESES